jgi:hypothetical protein
MTPASSVNPSPESHHLNPGEQETLPAGIPTCTRE